MKSNLKIVILFMFIAFCGVENSKLAYASDGWGSFGDHITWNYTESSGLLEIKGSGDMPEAGAPWRSFSGGIKKVIIGEGISSVSKELFSFYGQIEEVQLPSTIKSIAHDAFFDCGKLTKINFPDGLEEIGSYAFSGTALTSVTIPGTVEEIGGHAFSCSGTIANLVINEGVQEIGAWCFTSTNISCSLSIPSSVNTIGEHAFFHCGGLVSIEIPSSVEKIGKGAFCGCGNLRYAVINAPIDLPYECFRSCNALEMVKLNDGVKSIGDSSFAECTSLKAVYVPQTVVTIDNAFWGWGGEVISVTFYGYTGSTAWDYAGSHNGVNFIDISTADGMNSWNAMWTECVNRKETDSNANNNSTNTPSAKKETSSVGKVSSLKLKQKNHTVTISWKRVSKATGYQICYSTSKKWKNKKLKLTKKNKLTIKKLKKKKTYYFRVRAYQTKGKSKTYGPWSAVKKITMKK